jgi:hypothetical protein
LAVHYFVEVRRLGDIGRKQTDLLSLNANAPSTKPQPLSENSLRPRGMNASPGKSQSVSQMRQ